MENKPKIIVILGPTATGKSDLAVKLALRLRSGQAKKNGYNGAEIISADSRQVYKGLDIGTGKITEKEMAGIPHHMLDVVSPKRTFTVGEYKRKAEKILRYITGKGKLPIVVGGTGFYIQALVDNLQLPEVPPNLTLRKKLEKKSAEELYKILKKLDPKRAAAIDQHNPRRLIRAIEIAKALGMVSQNYKPRTTNYKPLFIGLDLPDKSLKKKISMRLFARIREGMIAEAKKLHKQELSYKRMEELGLEYRFLARYLKGEISKQEMQETLEKEIWKYAKRQRTWFKRDKRIKWLVPSKAENYLKEAEKLVKDFL